MPGETWVVLTGALLHAPFYFYVFYGTLRYVFHDDRVTTDELYAIGAAFTVLGRGGSPSWPSRSAGRGRSNR